MELKFTINLNPVTKKNSGRIAYRRLSNGKQTPIVLPSEAYERYERQCVEFMPFVDTIEHRVNVKAVFYMSTHRIVDLPNLQEALLDVLVHYGILKDDNSRIVATMDGSYVDYDKENPRTEVTITDK